MNNKESNNVDLVKQLFGDYQEITWLKDALYEYTCMTLTRDGKISWKDRDAFDGDTTSFSGTYTLVGQKDKFTVIGKGSYTALYDPMEKTESYRKDSDVRKIFPSSDFTGEGFIVTYK